MADSWSDIEVEAIVADYFDMLRRELAGQAYSKAAHRRALLQLLNGRSEQSIEFKHCNISAVLHDLGHIAIDGYKPRSNYQELLRERVVDRLVVDASLRSLELAAVDQPVHSNELVPLDLEFVDPPRRSELPTRTYERPAGRAVGRLGIDYLERESRNASLGLAGEKLVLELEHKRLWKAGKRDLANRVEHVSTSRGDGIGYDIHSFDNNGSDRLIEVKTTRFGQLTPFYASAGEVSASEREGDRYHLYRLFKFGVAPKIFYLRGSLRLNSELIPTMFRAKVL